MNRLLAAFAAVALLASGSSVIAQDAAGRSLAPPPDVGAPPADATKLPSGLAFKVLEPGTGIIHPTTDDLVKVDYTGWTARGRMFDSSVARGEAVTFPLSKAIPGWIEGMLGMVAGEKRRLWIPQTLAYNGQPGRPEGTIVFDVELLEVVSSPSTTPPPDVGAVPADALRTASGLAYRVLRPGTGTEQPSPTSRVTVHYSGWTADGNLFDSSVMRGTPATFRLGEVIDGWTEGVQLMTVGSRVRFWIPEELAYGGEAGSPAGMLVFDIELLSFEEPQ